MQNNCLKNQLKTKSLWKILENIPDIKQTKTNNDKLFNIKPTEMQSVTYEYVNNFFSSIGSDLASKITPLNSTQNLSDSNFPCQTQRSSFVLLDTDPHEVLEVLMSLKTDSASGWDHIPVSFLKLARYTLSPIISHLANTCFNEGFSLLP